MNTNTEITNRIRDLNDRFRKGDPTIPGKRLITSGAQDLLDHDPVKTAALMRSIAEFDAFDDDNDPHREHDFGALTFDDRKLFWKIDYYTPEILHGSEDPADIDKTVRVLTIMLAEEY